MKKIISLAILSSLSLSYTTPVSAIENAVLGIGVEQTKVVDNNKTKKKNSNQNIKKIS